MKKALLFVFSVAIGGNICGMGLDYDPQDILFKVCEGQFERQIIAMGFGEADFVRTLVSQKASVLAKNGLGEAPLHLAAKTGRYGVARELLAQGADPKAAEKVFGDTPLHAVIRCMMTSHHAQFMEILLQHDKTLVNIPNGEGDTPLHVAAVCGSDSSIKSLIVDDADISLKNTKGQTAVDWANYWNKTERAQLITDYYALHQRKKNEALVKNKQTTVEE